MKCRYNKCIYGGGEIEKGTEVQVGKGYYMHKECARYSKTIKKIVELYLASVDSTVMPKALYQVINKIVFDRKTDPEFLLFVLKGAIAEKIPIKAPYGLYYLVKDDEKIRKWKRSQAQKIISGIELAEKKKPTDYKYTPSQPLTLNSITEML